MSKQLIALPSNLFESTSIPTTMLVLSHDNEKIRMINAIDQCKKRKKNRILFTVKDVEYIAKLLKEEGEEARTS
ncbi:N-6 DNA methylase [Lachnobacterium bovis]|uniref:N-6 DNA methylase n=1 Tax=Lachnobacterium bovis TaxID=140626 RepID=UPI0004911318|nr:N-6 DNA methylase [Lachnobacterium bovis]